MYGLGLVEARFVGDVESLDSLGADFRLRFTVFLPHDIDHDSIVDDFSVFAGGESLCFQVLQKLSAIATKILLKGLIIFFINV